MGEKELFVIVKYDQTNEIPSRKFSWETIFCNDVALCLQTSLELLWKLSLEPMSCSFELPYS